MVSPAQEISTSNVCCMGALLSQAGLPAEFVTDTKELFRKSGVDQRVFLTDDYNAVSGLLKDLGVTSALDAFHIYSALHSSEWSYFIHLSRLKCVCQGKGH